MKHNWATFKVLAIVEFRTGITTYYIVPIKTLTCRKFRLFYENEESSFDVIAECPAKEKCFMLHLTSLPHLTEILYQIDRFLKDYR